MSVYVFLFGEGGQGGGQLFIHFRKCEKARSVLLLFFFSLLFDQSYQ